MKTLNEMKTSEVKFYTCCGYTLKYFTKDGELYVDKNCNGVFSKTKESIVDIKKKFKEKCEKKDMKGKNESTKKYEVLFTENEYNKVMNVLNESHAPMSKMEKYALMYCLLQFMDYNGSKIKVLSTLAEAEKGGISYIDEEEDITYYIGEGYFGSPGHDVDEDSVIVASYYNENEENEEPDDESKQNFDELINNTIKRFL